MNAPEGYEIRAFVLQGLWVAAPAGYTVTLGPPGIFLAAMGTQDDFQPLRIIGTLKFEDPGEPGETEFEFSPPAVLQVRYTSKDDSRATARGKPLTLAWWDGSRWVKFRRGENLLFEETPRSGGYVSFEIDRITDPGISWGT